MYRLALPVDPGKRKMEIFYGGTLLMFFMYMNKKKKEFEILSLNQYKIL